MPLGAQKLFPLKYSVLWKLSFEHFSNCRLSTFLSNQHFLIFFPTVTWGFAYTLLCSRHPEVTYQSCQGISAGVFCTCYSRKRLRSYVLTGLYSEALSGMSTPQLFSTLLTFVSFGFAAITYCFSIYYILVRSEALLPRPHFVATSWLSFNQLTFW